MSKLDLAYALTGKTPDQFHVPGKGTERVSFFGAGLVISVLVIGMLLQSSDSRDVPVLLAFAGFALLLFVRGILQRRHRLARAREIEELRTRLANASRI